MLVFWEENLLVSAPMIFFLSCLSTKNSIDSGLFDASQDSADTASSVEDSALVEPSQEPSQESSAFVLSLLVEGSPYGGLSFFSNLPRYQSDCIQSTAINTPCGDEDQDGLTDAWEVLILESMRPVLRLDEDEDFLTDPTAHFAHIGRVFPQGDYIDVYIVLGWSKDYGRCGVSAHNGDSERVVIRLVPDAAHMRFQKVYTAAHEGELTDAGKVWEEETLTELTVETDLQTGQAYWVVYPSEDKHATYGSIAACEASLIPCIEEDCAPDNVPNPQDFDIRGEIVHAGEESFPFITELSVIGFPGDEAWEEQDFCGGLGGDSCSSPIREKLLINPFD